MGKRGKKFFSNEFNTKWITFILLWTFGMSVFFTLISESLLKELNIILGFLLLVIIILIGIIFDIIGVAITSAIEKPFHSMAADKVDEAVYAIKLIRNAGQVSNFCNDVIGDICGIISGAVGTTIIYELIDIYSIKRGTLLSVIFTSLIAALTVGGKAFGKEIAIKYKNNIIIQISKFFKFMEEKFHINFLPDLKKKNNKKADKY